MRYIINTVNGASIGINECLDHKTLWTGYLNGV